MTCPSCGEETRELYGDNGIVRCPDCIYINRFWRWAAIIAVALLAIWIGTRYAGAAIIPATIPIPDSEVIQHNGLEWTYAGPVQPHAWGDPSQMEKPSYRAAEGWRFATKHEWRNRPGWYQFTRPGHDWPIVNEWGDGWFDDHESYRFTTAYWSDQYDGINLWETFHGIVANGNGVGFDDPAADVWYVRDIGNRLAVPEPGGVALAVFMLVLFGLTAVLIARNAKD